MAEPKDVEMTAAQAAKLVARSVPIKDEDGQPTDEFKPVSIKADEVLAFKDYGTHVVVVTVDGHKFMGQKPAEKATK